MTSRKLIVSTRKKKTTARTFAEKLVVLVNFIHDDQVGKVIIGKEPCSDPTKEKKEQKLESTGSTLKSNKKRDSKKIYIVKKKVDSDEESQFSNNVDESCKKPIGLYDEYDVAGQNICFFPTPKKRQGMIEKARESASKSISNLGTPKSKTRTPSNLGTPEQAVTPTHKLSFQQNISVNNQTPSFKYKPKKTSVTPRNIQKSDIVIPKTPYQLRARQKKAFQDHRRKLEACDNDSGDSDYNSSSESEDSDSVPEEENSTSDSGKGSEVGRSSCRRSIRFQQPPTTPCSRKRDKEFNYVFTADEYFQSKSSKCTTSDHNLSRLKTPRLDSSALHNLLTHCSVSQGHQQILAERRANDLAMFQRWMFALSQGFSIIAYGLGSKYEILQSFQCEMLSDSHVLVVNGFFPSLNVKEIVDMISKDLLGLAHVLPSPHAIIDWIENRRWMPHVFLIVHNLDADMLRCEKTQCILARLASLPKVHLVASIDHINCPLLWDQAKLSGFNFMWEDTTSLFPYKEETSYESSMMVQNSGSLALSSLLNVYRSLTNNSRGVFRIVLDKHLEENTQKYTGMAFSALYKRCREEMLVTSDLALRTMLTEFLDHQMIKWRQDGEHLYIPTNMNVLCQFHKLIQSE